MKTPAEVYRPSGLAYDGLHVLVDGAEASDHRGEFWAGETGFVVRLAQWRG
jgi:hypothetical protein